MKTLTLLRHAKSDWGSGVASDHERPINRRGRSSATAVGQFLRRADRVPDAVLTSTAVRARTTAERAADAGDWSCPIIGTSELYDSDPNTVLDILQQQDDAYQHLLLAGHEPTWSQMASQLIGGGNLEVVTATLVHIELPIGHWSQAMWGRGRLLWMLPPRLLMAGHLDQS